MLPPVIERIIQQAIAIQQIPAPTFSEGHRATYVYRRFREEGLTDVSIDDTGNVYALLSGRGEARPLVVSAHLDTVFPKSTDLSVDYQGDKVKAPGIGDNSLGVAALFGLCWMLRDSGVKLPGDLWLVANVGEEGLGDLVGMRAVVDRFEDRPVAYLVLEGLALGQVYHRALGSERFRIRVQTRGGHSWVDYGSPSAVRELADLVVRITEIRLPDSPRTTLNVGTIEGGSSINTIASWAELTLDLRSEALPTLSTLVEQVHELVVKSNRDGVRISIDRIGQRPVGEISANHGLVRLAQHCLQSQGIKPVLNIGSTDANIPLSRNLPALCIGLTTGFGAHTSGEYVFTQPLVHGMAQLMMFVQQVYALKE